MKNEKTNQINGMSLGWNITVLFILGTILLGGLAESYDPISQTVSEIGRTGSVVKVPWQILCVFVGLLSGVFSGLLISFARKNQLSVVPGLFLLSYALCQIGLGFFPVAHPLHNVFGLFMIIGYCAPLSFALLWKNRMSAAFTVVSFGCFLLVVAGIFLNLTPAFSPELYPLEYYGVVQRFLLFTFYLYIAFLSIYLSSVSISFPLKSVSV